MRKKEGMEREEEKVEIMQSEMKQNKEKGERE